MVASKRITQGNGFNLKASFSKGLAKLSKVGKSLLYPIAMLPLAAIFLRIGVAIASASTVTISGQPVVLNHFANVVGLIFEGAGNSVFSTLPIIFAIGVAFGLSKDSRGEAAICGFLSMALLSILLSAPLSPNHLGATTAWFGGMDLVDKIYGNLHFSNPTKGYATATGFHQILGDKYNDILVGNVFNGIIVGSIIAYIYNKFNNIELPSVLGFFSGRRLVPVLSIAVTLIFTIIWAVIWPWAGFALNELSISMGKATGNRWSNASIMFIYGFLNRLLIPFGLHTIPNTFFWFILGSHPDVSGATVNGDINIFIKGVPLGNHAGTFQSGFFPVMMFGLPAIVVAIWYCADSAEQRKRVIGLMGGSALVSFFTGITEPIEYAFLYVAPLLFGLHALLTGIFGFITGLFGIQLGFGFSAGFIDYVLSIPKSLQIIEANKTGIDAVMANPAWIWPIGMLAAVTYFYTSKFVIKKFNISTPGRGKSMITNDMVDSTKSQKANDSTSGFSKKAARIVYGLGGWNNIKSFDNCATRLRYDLEDSDLVDVEFLRQSGVIGTSIISKTHVQVVVGPTVGIVNDEIIANKGANLKDYIGDINESKQQVQKELKETDVEISVISPTEGQIVNLSESKDKLFADGILGKGFVVKPTSNDFRAPISGTISALPDTKHSYAITNTDITILVHIGVDTVKLNGQFFEAHLKQGDTVKVGEKIITANLAEIEKQYPIDTMVVCLPESKGKVKDILNHEQINAENLSNKIIMKVISLQ